MNNADFWASVNGIIDQGFTSEGLRQLDCYAEQFISERLIYQRFSPFEQHGCSTGGTTHVIATLLSAAKTGSDQSPQVEFPSFQAEFECSSQQAQSIEFWARIVGCWTDNVTQVLTHDLGKQLAEGGEAIVFDHGPTLVKSIGLEYYIQPLLALDRISLHNAFFPETRLTTLGFGRDEEGNFKIIVEQPYIIGGHASDQEISEYLKQMGFELKEPRSWTYATTETYFE